VLKIWENPGGEFLAFDSRAWCLVCTEPGRGEAVTGLTPSGSRAAERDPAGAQAAGTAVPRPEPQLDSKESLRAPRPAPRLFTLFRTPVEGAQLLGAHLLRCQCPRCSSAARFCCRVRFLLWHCPAPVNLGVTGYGLPGPRAVGELPGPRRAGELPALAEIVCGFGQV